jgi:hypothetical protein
MKRIMMLALAVCSPFTQACEDTRLIEEKAGWVCQNLHPLEFAHAADLFPETHPVADYVVDEDVRFTERKLDEIYTQTRDIGDGWEEGARRGIVAVGRVTARRGECALTSMKRVEYGERYRVEFTRDYEAPDGEIPIQPIIDDAFEGFMEEKGKLGLVVLMFTMDVSDIVPSRVRMEQVYEEAWDRQGSVQKRRTVSFDMVRVGGTWKAELDLEARYGDDAEGAGIKGYIGSGDDDSEEGSSKEDEKDEPAKEAEPSRDEGKEEALQKRIEALEQEVRELKRERTRIEQRDDGVDIEITW